jgi:ParB-like chromosome segregation protein Spo0J
MTAPIHYPPRHCDECSVWQLRDSPARGNHLKRTKRMKRPIHPIADLIPPMSAAEFADLRASIKTEGLRVPITLHTDGSILDGRHRARACAELGIVPRTETFMGNEAQCLDYVLDLNLKRRHLDESQRAMIAAELATLRQGARTDLAPIGAMSQSEAADRLNVSRRTTQRAVLVRDKAIPAIVEAVRQGDMPVSLAARVAQLPATRQQQVVAEMHNGKSLSTTVLAATRIERMAEIELASTACPLSALGRTYPVIYADPPWRFEAWSEGGQLKAPEMQYPTMHPAEIAALPVADVAAADSVLFMWAVPDRCHAWQYAASAISAFVGF